VRGQQRFTALRSQALRVLDRVPPLRRTLSELARIEVMDRSLALGAQALLALIPMLIVLGAFMPAAWGDGVLLQIRDTIGVREDVMEPLREMAVQRPVSATEVGLVGLLVSLVSASSFSRALQRMYARAWGLPTTGGVQALRGSFVWLIGWLLMLQVTALLMRSVSGIPLTGLVRTTIQFAANTVVWWWTSRLLLGGRVSWQRLLPGALLSGLLIVGLTRASSLFMPRFARANLEQFGPLGVVFSIGSWLVVFGGVLVVAAVVGRQIGEWWLPEQGRPQPG